MKTTPTSLRFDKNDLLLATNKSGIKKPQKLMDFLLSEYVRDLKPQYLTLPKDYINTSGKISAVDKTGEVVIPDIADAAKKSATANTISEYQNEMKGLGDTGLARRRKIYLQGQIDKLKKSL
jgi:hypothetical protein